MDDALLNIWHAALPLIEEEVSPVGYKTFILPIEPQKLENQFLHISVPNEIVHNMVTQRYKDLIQNAIYEVSKKRCTLQVQIGTPQEEKKEKIAKNLGLPLNPKYTFDTFVVGGSNRFAHAASLAVAETPARAYNPLFLYGGVGLGKTHLMNAIGNFILQQDPTANILFTTSETFTNELIDSIISKKGTGTLRNRMRNVDVLMVDDIQFLSKTKATQEEFFHTFNDLYSKGKQIIISSDRPPKDIPTIEERLRSRFEWGLIVDIQKPDYETRVAILRRKADEEGIDVPYDVIDYIAERVESNIRELEGTLTRLNAQCQLMGMPLNLECVRDSLSQLVKSPEGRRITPELIISVIADQYGVTSEDIISKKRSRDIALPRQIAMYLCRNMTQLSTTNIGRSFGGRDHTTVMHGCDKIAQEMNDNFSFRKRIEELTSLIKNG